MANVYGFYWTNPTLISDERYTVPIFADSLEQAIQELVGSGYVDSPCQLVGVRSEDKQTQDHEKVRELWQRLVLKPIELKVWPIEFQAIWDKQKSFEIRKADRPYKVGSILLLQEWNPATQEYSSRSILAVVTYLVEPGLWGLQPTHCAMGIRIEACNDGTTTQ